MNLPPLGFDCETDAFTPGRMAPPLVSLAYCEPGGKPAIMNWREAIEFALWMLRSGRLLVGHNIAYDWRVIVAQAAELGLDLLPEVYGAYEDHRITDTMWRQCLADIGRGRYRTRKYNLGSCASIHGFPGINKEDPWRTRYGTLRDIPVTSWPEDALAYALMDPLATIHVYGSQTERYHPALLVDEYFQARRFWALGLVSCWGLRTTQRGVADLENGTLEALAACTADLQEEGLVRENGTRDTKAAKQAMIACCNYNGVSVPLTKTGKDRIKAGELDYDGAVAAGYVSLDSDACESSGDPLLESYAEFSALQKVLSNDIKWMRTGVEYPIHTRFDLAETGRTTSSKPNVQNPRRLAGVRECYVPRQDVELLYVNHSAIGKGNHVSIQRA